MAFVSEQPLVSGQALSLLTVAATIALSFAIPRELCGSSRAGLVAAGLTAGNIHLWRWTGTFLETTFACALLLGIVRCALRLPLAGTRSFTGPITHSSAHSFAHSFSLGVSIDLEAQPESPPAFCAGRSAPVFKKFLPIRFGPLSDGDGFGLAFIARSEQQISRADRFHAAAQRRLVFGLHHKVNVVVLNAVMDETKVAPLTRLPKTPAQLQNEPATPQPRQTTPHPQRHMHRLPPQNRSRRFFRSQIRPEGFRPAPGRGPPRPLRMRWSSKLCCRGVRLRIGENIAKIFRHATPI